MLIYPFGVCVVFRDICVVCLGGGVGGVCVHRCCRGLSSELLTRYTGVTFNEAEFFQSLKDAQYEMMHLCRCTNLSGLNRIRAGTSQGFMAK